MLHQPAKLTIWALATGLAALLGASAFSKALERKSPEVAESAFPANGSAQTRLAEQQFYLAKLAERDKQPHEEALRHGAYREARHALALQPLNPRALRIVAMMGPKDARTESLYASNRLSRRDTLAQAMLIEDAAKRGEVARAMAHYDALLRRNTGYRDLAGRGLALAVAYPDLVGEITAMLRKNPPWISLFYHYVVQEKRSANGFLQIIRNLEDTDLVPLAIKAEFARNLVDAGEFDKAAEVTRLGGADPLQPRTRLAISDFDTEPGLPGNWRIDDSVAISFQPIQGGGALLGLSRGVTGAVARRLVRLQPGKSYHAELLIDEEDDESASRAPVDLLAGLTCASKNGGSRMANPLATLAVSSDCPYQWLWIVVPQSSSLDQDVFVQQIRVSANG